MQLTAHFCASSMTAATFGGIGSRQASGSHAHWRTQPPIFEYVLSGAFGSGSQYSAESQRSAVTSLML